METEGKPSEKGDGSAGDANYGLISSNYSSYRRPDPYIADFIRKSLGDAKTVLNVGAGPGSYEPLDRDVTAVEPSSSMRSQRHPQLPKAIDAVAEDLPFADESFDACMAIFTVHQWLDLSAGLREMRRVSRGPVLILTCDPAELKHFWLNVYAPEVIAVESRRYPSMEAIKEVLGGKVDIFLVPIPLNCMDGFNEAYYGRPERLLEAGARQANSAWSFVDQATRSRSVIKLEHDITTGTWDLRYGKYRTQPFFEGSLRLIVAHP